MTRSYLFAPGSRPERFAKALASGAHAVIVDLEDGVAPAAKAAAREAIAGWLNAAHPVVLRVNGIGTEWFSADSDLCRLAGISAVMLPKVESAEDVLTVGRYTAPGVAILAQIETAAGLANALEIGRSAGVERLVFGPLDFQADLGIEGDGEELLFARSQLVFISRLAGILPPVDGPETAIADAERLRERTAAARRLGFGGKLCIHPNQVAVVNECFRPTAAEVEWARRVVAASEEAAGGAVAVDGRMVDRPVVLRAQRMLQEAGQGTVGDTC